MECSLLDASVHGISQARILEWVAVPFSKGSSRPKDRKIKASSLESPAPVGGFFTTSTGWEASPHTEIHKDLCPPFFRKNKISYNFFLHHQREDWVPSKLLVTFGYPYKLLVTFVLLVPLKPECMCFEHISAVSQMSKRNLPRTPFGQKAPCSPPTIPPACCFPCFTLLPCPAKRGVRVPSVLCWSVRAKVFCLKSASAPVEDRLVFSGWS